jgi:hypothetical protein
MCRVRFTCPACKAQVSTEVDVPEPNWSAERASDAGSEDQTDVQCPKCKAGFPAFCSNSASSCEITLDDYPDTTIETELAYYEPSDEDDEGWDADYEPPDNPYWIFTASHDQAIELLNSSGGDGTHLINRMVFAHLIGALEAFLGDTFINAVMKDEEKKKKLLQFDTELAGRRFGLSEVNADPDLVNKEIRSYLRSVLYHNIAKVHVMYKNVLGVDVFEVLGERKNDLFKAVEYRHDCVHRNGFDKDGVKLEVFSKEYVTGASEIANALVNGIYARVMFSGVSALVSSAE